MLLGLLAFFSAQDARALNPESRISQYGHTVWRIQEGYLSATPSSFAQTSDGYLWIGTDGGGLYRFDGVSFTHWELPAKLKSKFATALIGPLYAAPDGSLWADYSRYLLQIDRGKFKIAHPAGILGGITEDQDGSLWFTHKSANVQGGPLCRAVSGDIHCYGKRDGIQTQAATAIVMGKESQFWVGGSGSLLEWKGHLLHEYPLPGRKLDNNNDYVIEALAAEAGGGVWVGVGHAGPGGGLQRFADGKWTPYHAPGLNGASIEVSALLLDSDGSLWVGTEGKGLYRIHGDSVDHYGRTDGLSGDNIEKIFQDREGGIWIATGDGVDHFYAMPVVTYSNPQGLVGDVDSVLGRRDGSVVAVSLESVSSIRGSTVTPLLSNTGGHGRLCLTSLEDHLGNLWIATDGGGLTVQTKDRLRVVIQGKSGIIQSLVEDTDHSIWAEFGGDAHLVRIENYRVREEFRPPQIPAGYSLIADPRGGVWLSLHSDKLMHYQKGQWRELSLEPVTRRFGPLGGAFNMAYDADGTLWLGTLAGAVGYRDGKLQILNEQNGIPCKGAYSLISDIHNDLWVHTMCGLVRVEHSELQRWWANAESILKTSTYASPEGFRLGGPAGRPAATRSSDGKLWFQNNIVVLMIDPNRLGGNTVVPPVHIEQVIADRTLYPAQNGMQLPIKTRQVELDYTGLSFVMPSKVNFRYRLEGHDVQWQEPGTRRAAFYNDLSPGHYTFRVIAPNNSGLWNTEGASLQFNIPPAYYQTSWFRALCVLMFLAFLWLLYELRLRQLRQEFIIGLESRVLERTRIARDLHDTLLQSMQALLLRLQTVSNVLPVQPDEAKRRVDRAIEQASNAVTEGRDALNELRSCGPTAIDLDLAISNFAKELLSGLALNSAPEVHVQVEGTPRSLNPVVRDEIYRVTTEAIRNAIRHANATRIEVEIRYDENHLHVRIGDNGSGIDLATLNHESKAGHWGLRGMRERAKLVGAALEVWSKVDVGTEIELNIPAASVYATPSVRLPSIFSRFGSS
jgi:signal transduction histidine kinase/ligand-binding sensor domain-containing protein